MNKPAFAATALLAGSLGSALAFGCGGDAAETPPPVVAPTASTTADASAVVAADTGALHLTLLGTNDLHGRIAVLPMLSGYVADVRAAMGASSVVLLDAGDMFQGTLESNLAEGEPVIRGYNAIGYDAAAIGNHEFDFGPVGARATPQTSSDEPRGALQARATEAHFPFLGANIASSATHRPIDWPNVQSTVLLNKAGIKVGVIGAATTDVPRTTIASNFAGLEILPLAPVVEARAAELRKAGADLVFLVTHAGGKCLSFGEDATSCEKDEEIMHLLSAVPHGTLDAVVAGHTHQGMANRIEGVPVIESYFNGKAFGRVDFTLDRTTHKILSSKIYAPTPIAPSPNASSVPVMYEGTPVTPDATLAAALAPYADRARARKEEKIGVTLDTTIAREHAHESPEGNLFADLLKLGTPGADVAMTNGGGLRADLPPGELTFGALFEAMPFDNRVALVKFKGADLRRVVVDNLTHASGIASWSGIRIVASCTKGALTVRLEKPNGKAIADGDDVTMVTSDFVALGGDGAPFPPSSVTVEDPAIRDVFEAQLKKRGGHLSASNLFDPSKRRVVYPGERPVKCTN